VSKPTEDEILKQLRELDPKNRRRIFATLKNEREERERQTKTQAQQMPNTHWSQAHVLSRIENPTSEAYEQKILVPELTFLGVANQPDFGEVLLTFYPAKWTIELKSLKLYYQSFRNEGAFYEAVTNQIRDDLQACMKPNWMEVTTEWKGRGGIRSTITATAGEEM